MKKRGLSGAVRPDEADERAPLDGEGDRASSVGFASATDRRGACRPTGPLSRAWLRYENRWIWTFPPWSGLSSGPEAYAAVMIWYVSGPGVLPGSPRSRTRIR